MELGRMFESEDEWMIDLLKKLKHDDPLPRNFKISRKDIYACHPKLLQGSSKEYYFNRVEFKHRQGTRVNRTVHTDEGFWKNYKTVDIEGKTRGQKTLFTFYEGKGNDKKATKWTMYEYSDLDGTTSAKIVLCTIHERVKKIITTSPSTSANEEVTGISNSQNPIMNQIHLPPLSQECRDMPPSDYFDWANEYWDDCHDAYGNYTNN